ncbi:hypothetical protein CEG14_19785 [Bordetella genomosp. 1]|uniref:Tetratrico peptide repeat group 5 domain-containing protein n=1 Tax=Bordetella genomosp. 1 TaxID=1395607 RepID=A0A261S9L2_9BORD|nr:hypothetical protein [Bordetella genomosp. 1]OZI33093.1 hypothetical protein CEG14_19785 [Bordetella genomosp. 1]OZI57198.1 hypothetical protein CAL27_23445 [Bordetella genomosp. 1]
MNAIAAPLTETHAELLGLLASVYLENNRPEKAAVLLAALDALGLAQPRQRVALALAQLRAQKPNDALGTLERIALSGAIDATFHLVRAQVLTVLERPQEAGAAMRAYVALRGAPVPPSVSA